jgi:hypothetical protein
MEVWTTPVVMVETLALVYYNAIRRALRAGGYNWRNYWRASWTKMNASWRLMDRSRHDNAWARDEMNAQKE